MQPATSQPIAAGLPRSTHTFWQGFWSGLIPLALLTVIVVATLALTTLARLLAAPAGFLVWRWIVVGIWLGGLIIAVAVFLYAAFRVLRLAKGWRRAGLRSQASGAFWALGVSALIVLLPLLVAAVFPQHPAPPNIGAAQWQQVIASL